MLPLAHHLDRETLTPQPTPFFLPAARLTRHGVCIGMTGSGKTGLCLALLESIADQGVPILAIDPKGDVSNLALVFDALSPERFAPWLEPGRSARAAADAWRQGLAESGLSEVDLRRWRERVDVRVLTPGSESGTPVDVLTALTTAPRHLLGDPEALREYVTGAVSALIGLIGREADPLNDPSAILLARLLGDTFARGEDLPLDRLIPQVVDPPFSTVGYFPVDTFLPRAERLDLARALNAVIASPSFTAWRMGVPLDIAAWLAPADGRTPVRILHLAHLDDTQRMFFVTLLLHAAVAWSRRQPGTSELRALLYFDEVMGFLPPHPHNPPSKAGVLTLMKQARSVGFGVMLCTQNPVDVDYKALSNAATWLVGRLQTRQDRARVADALGPDTAGLLPRLQPRTFLVQGDGETTLVRSRHTMSLLRGPLTRRELTLLQRSHITGPTAPPPLPASLTARWLDAEGLTALGLSRPAAAPVWRPALYGRLRLRLNARGHEESRVIHRLRLGDGAVQPVPLEDRWLHRRAPMGGTYPDHPMPSAPEVARLRERWEAEAVRDETALHPRDGGLVTAGRHDVELLGFVLLWVPT
jgi:hypothetical protein